MSDNFERFTPVTASSIKDITTTLMDPDPTGTRQRSARAKIHIEMSDGTIRVKRVNLANHFSQAVIDQLISFVTSIRTKAENEILPEVEE